MWCDSPVCCMRNLLARNRNRNSVSRIQKTFSCGMCWCLLWLFTLCRCGVVNCDQMAMSGPRHVATSPLMGSPLLHCSVSPPSAAVMVVTNKTYCPGLHQILDDYLKDLWEISNQESYLDLPHPQPLSCQLISILILHHVLKFKFPPSDCFSTKLSLFNPSTISKQQKACVLTVPMAPGWLAGDTSWQCNL